MYDELVKRLNAYSAEHECHGGITAEAADAIEELTKPRWIPVTERLPEKGRYLVVCKTIISGEQIARILRFSENLESVDEYDFEGENRSGWYYYDDEYGHIEVDDVTHWMPLPEPPKESET